MKFEIPSKSNMKNVSKKNPKALASIVYKRSGIQIIQFNKWDLNSDTGTAIKMGWFKIINL